MSSTISNQQSVSQLGSFGLIKLAGEGVIKFLQGQITINAETMEPGQLSLAAICNPQGRCVSLFFITKINQQVWLILKNETIESTITTLKKYAVFFKVEIIDCSEQNIIYGLNNITFKHNQVNENWHIVNWNKPAITLAIVPREAQQAWEKETYQLSDEQNWLFDLTNKRISWLDLNSQSQFLPHNLNLPELNAVDFNKGCFTGQEVIARMQYKGKLKSHLQLFQLSSSVTVKSLEIIFADGKSAAQVVCSANNDTDCRVILALVKDRYLDSQIFRLNSENGPILELIKSN